jgi:FKBP-type peptidyl-prolyl cis-trans isomerase FklB
MLQRRALLTLAAAAALAACTKKPPPKVEAAPEDPFLAANAKVAGVHVTKSGLQYRVVRAGPETGLRPKLGDEVKVNYEGKLVSGEVFDSSFERGAPVVMLLRKGGLIPGWIEALQLMRPGDEWQVFIPAKLGYGAEGKGPIPPDSTLVFRIELLGVLPGESSTGRA